MGRPFNPDKTPMKATGVNLEEIQVKFLVHKGNKSAYVRWLLDNDPECKKYKKKSNTHHESKPL